MNILLKFFKFYEVRAIGLRFLLFMVNGVDQICSIKYLQTAHENNKFIYYNKEIMLEILHILMTL